MTEPTQIIHMDDARVRLSGDELHRRVCKAIHESDHTVFDSMPSLIAQIIEHKVWKNYGHKNFADYALDPGSNGLGINSNQRLWLLRCAMDANGAHVEEWAGVLVKVEEMVRIEAKRDGQAIRNGRGFDGNSLENLAKNGGNLASTEQRITYLPSKQRATDGALLRLRKNHPDTFRRVLDGEMTARQGMVAARRADGERIDRVTLLGRAQHAVRKMTPDERAEFAAWFADEFGDGSDIDEALSRAQAE